MNRLWSTSHFVQTFCDLGFTLYVDCLVCQFVILNENATCLLLPLSSRLLSQRLDIRSLASSQRVTNTEGVQEKSVWKRVVSKAYTENWSFGPVAIGDKNVSNRVWFRRIKGFHVHPSSWKPKHSTEYKFLKWKNKWMNDGRLELLKQCFSHY